MTNKRVCVLLFCCTSPWPAFACAVCLCLSLRARSQVCAVGRGALSRFQRHSCTAAVKILTLAMRQLMLPWLHLWAVIHREWHKHCAGARQGGAGEEHCSQISPLHHIQWRHEAHVNSRGAGRWWALYGPPSLQWLYHRMLTCVLERAWSLCSPLGADSDEISLIAPTHAFTHFCFESFCISLSFFIFVKYWGTVVNFIVLCLFLFFYFVFLFISDVQIYISVRPTSPLTHLFPRSVQCLYW